MLSCSSEHQHFLRRYGPRIVLLTFFIFVVFRLLFWDYVAVDFGKRNLNACLQGHYKEEGVAIIMDSLKNSKLEKMGGTSQWFHLTESLLPSLYFAVGSVWKRKLGGLSPEVIYIIFREEGSVVDLGPFGRMLTSIILTGGLYSTIVFGHAKHVVLDHIDAQNNSIMWVDKFSTSFVADLKEQSTSDLFLQDVDRNGIPREVRSMCIHSLLHVQWLEPMNKHELLTSIENITSFQESFSRICNIPFSMPTPPAHSIKYTPVTYPSVHTTLPSDMLEGKEDHMFLRALRLPDIWTAYTKHHEAFFYPVPYAVSGAPKNILIYQRNLYRQILDEGSLLDKLSSSIKSTARWNVKSITHSNERSPCDLITEVHKSTVLITSHGFQSTLLLFQPLHSLLVELHPSAFYKPHVYGPIQASYRHFMNISRAYLSYESAPQSQLLDVMLSAMNAVGFGREYCVYSTLCRYVAKNQDVGVTDASIEKIGWYVNKYFP